MDDPRFKLYSFARIVGDRPELADIIGERAAIIERRQSDDGRWLYIVSPDIGQDTYECSEFELSPLDADDAHGIPGATTKGVLRINEVNFQVKSAWLSCVITKNGGTDWSKRTRRIGFS